MKIRVLMRRYVPDKYCNEENDICRYLKKARWLHGPQCDLFSAKLRQDGNNIIKCHDCIKAAGEIVTQGCEFCGDGVLEGYARKYTGPCYETADPPYCPECGRRRR